MDYTQLKMAIERFGDMLAAFRENEKRPPLEQEAVQDSLIKRFEYTLEVAWKTCKQHLTEEGFAEAATGSPKSILRLAAQQKLVDDPEAWFGYLRLRTNILLDFSSDNVMAVLDIAEKFCQNVMKFYRGMAGEGKDIRYNKFTIRARGYYVASFERPSFVVLKDSMASKYEHSSLKPIYIELRKELVEKGILVDDGSYLKFTENYKFDSPSAAACVIEGTSKSGPETWGKL